MLLIENLYSSIWAVSMLLTCTFKHMMLVMLAFQGMEMVWGLCTHFKWFLSRLKPMTVDLVARSNVKSKIEQFILFCQLI